ncbi:peptide deformylase, partial [Actinomycetota bacterium]
MAIKKIRKIGDPVLRETSSNVEDIDKSVLGLVSDMLDTLEGEGGVGLAAPQIGITKRIIVVRYEDKIDTYINPEIESLENKKIKEDEGCLSIYSIQGFQVKRYPKIKMKATNIKGNTEEFIAEDLLARVIQHEVDHLNG